MRQGPLAGRYPRGRGDGDVRPDPLPGAVRGASAADADHRQAAAHEPPDDEPGLGLANAAYAAGTVLAVSLAQHLPQRRMLVVYATLLVIGSVLAAAAQSPGMYIAGHVLQGLCTSLLLISAVPPLAIGYPASKLRITAVIMNMCIFGAVALGPAIGGLQAESNAWRPLFWIIAAIAASALVLAVLTFDDAPPADPDSPRDPLAIGLAAVGCVAAFFGASELLTHSFLDPITIVPLLGGLALIVTLIVYQFRAKRPLLTIRTMLTSTMPVAGIVVALFAAAASVSATALTAGALTEMYSPLHLGLLYLPELAGAVITAVALGVVIKTRAMHYLPLVGMLFLAAGIAVFRIHVPSSEAATLIGSGLTGIGLGATVAPALFVAGFSLPSASLQRVFAIVELMRAVAAFMIAPIFVHFASNFSGGLDAGTGVALWIGLALAVGGAVSASRSTRSAARVRRRLTSTASSRARLRRGTRRRCWRGFAAASAPHVPRPQLGALDLARGGLRQLRGEVDDPRVLVRGGLALDVLLQLARQLGRGHVALARARPPRARPSRARHPGPPRRRPRRRLGARRAPTPPRMVRCGSPPRRSRRRCVPRSTASRPRRA